MPPKAAPFFVLFSLFENIYLPTLIKAVAHHGSMLKQGTDNIAELSYQDRRRIHNLKYYTWVEQQGRTVDELEAQWYDETYWTSVQGQIDAVDAAIVAFNSMVGR